MKWEDIHTEEQAAEEWFRMNKCRFCREGNEPEMGTHLINGTKVPCENPRKDET